MLAAVPLEDEKARRPGAVQGFGHQPALANAGIARNEDAAAIALLSSVQGSFEHVNLARATDQDGRDDWAME